MAQNLAAALAEFQASLPRIAKAQTANVPTKNGGSYEYSYADLAAVTNEILPMLAKHGLVWITMPTTVDGRFVLAYRLLHTSGEAVEGEYPLPSNLAPQQTGSAITYARRYCLCSVTGVAPDSDDDDAAAAQQGARRPVQRSRRQQAGPDDEPPPWANEEEPRRPVQRAQRPGRPPLPGEADSSQPAGRRAGRPRPITDEQMRKLHASFGDLGITEREDRLAYASGVIDRALESSKDLTAEEASRVIEQLVTDAEPPAPAEGGERA